MVSPEPHVSSVNATTVFVTINSTIFNNITAILLDNLNFELTFITAFQPKRKCYIICILSVRINVKTLHVACVTCIT